MKIDDRKLIENYLKGDEKALKLLIRNYLNLVYNFVLGYVNNPRDAEELKKKLEAVGAVAEIQ